MRLQLFKYNWSDAKNFSFFVAKNSFNMLISIVKNYKTFEGEMCELYKSYYSKAKDNKWAFLGSKQVSAKEKILFVLLLTGLYKAGLGFEK